MPHKILAFAGSPRRGGNSETLLDRAIAERGRYPAINVLRSISRTLPGCNSKAENDLVLAARQYMATFEDMAELIRLGAYRKGSDAKVDEAIRSLPEHQRLQPLSPDLLAKQAGAPFPNRGDHHPGRDGAGQGNGGGKVGSGRSWSSLRMFPSSLCGGGSARHGLRAENHAKTTLAGGSECQDRPRDSSLGEESSRRLEDDVADC